MVRVVVIGSGSGSRSMSGGVSGSDSRPVGQEAVCSIGEGCETAGGRVQQGVVLQLPES